MKKPLIVRFISICLIAVFMSAFFRPAFAEDEPLATIMFCSDYQQGGTVPPAVTLDNIERRIAEDTAIDLFVGCGDYTNIEGYSNYNAPEKDTFVAMNKMKSITKNVFGDVEYLFLQGNHDPFLEEYSGRHLMDKSGAYEYPDYTVYVINTEGGNPWGQGVTGSEEILKNTAAELREYFRERIVNSDSRPVFVATHVPLHYSGRTSSIYGSGDNMYSKYLFDVINEAAEKLDIVYIFGHNHSKGFDNYLGYGSICKFSGDILLIPDARNVVWQAFPYTDKYTVETLNFTYMNAGYVGYIESSESEENGTLTASVVKVYSDRIVIARYDENGLHDLSGQGTYNNNEYYPDSGVFDIDDESILASSQPSPAEIIRRLDVTPDYITGDVNCDGFINSIDANLLKKALGGVYELPPNSQKAADMNSDGFVNTIDANLIKKYLSGA